MAGGPSNAIYAFWDDLSFGGGGAAVRQWTIGLPPNQIHCVQWFNMTPSGGSGALTTTIRIYEGGDFDIVWDIGNGTTSTSSGTVGTEDAFDSDGSQVQSAPVTQFPASTSDNNDDTVVSGSTASSPPGTSAFSRSTFPRPLA